MVRVDNTFSKEEKTTFGIPLGTILGQVLFLIYIIGLLNLNFHGKVIFFANDTVLLLNDKSIDKLNDKGNVGFALVNQWLDIITHCN